jgi:hypothetical protein
MKKPQTILKKDIAEASQKITVGGVYKHYKNSSYRYKVIDLAINADDSSVWFIYKALYDEQIMFLRSLDEWCQTVQTDDGPVKRFTAL